MEQILLLKLMVHIMKTIGQNWLPNRTYNYVDTNGAVFNVVVDSNR